ncbi:hypothetical protein T484DRAFT_1881747 [Baffinella frigidus]|nr:hypothetical protein T484DRAFT_1881747 [Cryptophyta sp. CCMP2293]
MALASEDEVRTAQAQKEEEGNALFRTCQADLKSGNLAEARVGFQKAAIAYAAAGNEKKKELMTQMFKRIDDGASASELPKGPAKPPAKSPQAAPQTPAKKQDVSPGSKAAGAGGSAEKSPAARYSFNYDRFNNLDDSDDEEDPKETKPAGMKGSGGMPAVPAELMEAVMRAEEARRRGMPDETVKNLEKLAGQALKDADPRTRAEVMKMLSAGGADIAPPPPTPAVPDAPVDADPDALMERLKGMQDAMQADLEGLRQQQEKITANEDALGQASSFEDLAKFMVLAPTAGYKWIS